MPKPKPKQFLQLKKQSKSKQSEEPESANEFLEAGVDLEEAGEKWRAGDAAKSLRFFTRAIDKYGAGLQRFPADFDLAYNKARLQYDVAQQPRLLVHVSKPLNELLQIALKSHQYAIRINDSNADVLLYASPRFMSTLLIEASNTGQVLTSLAETLLDERAVSVDQRQQALKILQEALEYFQRCFDLQEYQYNLSQENPPEDAADSEQVSSSATQDDRDMDLSAEGEAEQTQEETWATLVEPVTLNSLLDTTLAQLETLTAICSLDGPQPDWPFGWVEEFFQSSLQGKLTSFANSTSRSQEVNLAVAKFRSALSQAAFRCNRIDVQTYARELLYAFQPVDLSQDPQSLCDRADAEMALVTTIRQQSQQQSQNEPFFESPEAFSKFVWTHATTALDSLTAASKLPHAQNLARIHMRRGDCEMYRFSLAEPPNNYALAAKSIPTLLGNAALYYRMAGRQAGAEGTVAKEDGEEAYVKELIVEMLIEASTTNDKADLAGLSASTRKDVRDVVEEMREEGILGAGCAERVSGMLD